MIDWVLLVVSVAIPLGISLLAARDSKPGKAYEKLKKPRWTLAVGSMSIIWSAMQVLSGLALYLLLVAQAWGLVVLWAVQLSLSVMWADIMYARKDPLYALADMLALDLSVIALMLASLQINIWATIILVPYLLWLLFVTGLTETVWKLNRPKRL